MAGEGEGRLREREDVERRFVVEYERCARSEEGRELS
jgi:hypothetical protein